MRFLYTICLTLFLGCGPVKSDDRSGPSLPNTPNPSEVVVVGTASFAVLVGPDGQLQLASTYPVVVNLAASSTFAISTTNFVVPAVTNAVLDFGTIAVTAASTNKLKLCGPGGNQKCTRALLRIYTTTAAGAGFWNGVDGYGAPMTAGLTGALQAVALGQVNAVIVHSYTIPGNRNTVKLTDFSPTPTFSFMGDFTDAGEGAYSTTIAVEFALAP
jgi:hypothetical protein